MQVDVAVDRLKDAGLAMLRAHEDLAARTLLATRMSEAKALSKEYEGALLPVPSATEQAATKLEHRQPPPPTPSSRLDSMEGRRDSRSSM